jgi:MoaA/NifB/PqqE/SkfB family radical SAM enzyme
VAISIDLELTNRCNAKCHFCPRDATPHQGLMTREVFDQALVRAVEYRDLIRESGSFDPGLSLCGLGEPLLNPRFAEYTQKGKDEGFRVTMSSNASILDERRGRQLLDAGLDQIMVNVGARDDEYEEVYQLPFEKTRDNLIRFAEMAGDDCVVTIVLVDYRRDPAAQAEMRDYWSGYGFTSFQEFAIINRGGALFVDHMQFESLGELVEAEKMLAGDATPPLCGAPFAYLFVGYDGNYYLCCSDWTKEVPFGTVFDRSFKELTREKLRHVFERRSICQTCNLDPLNLLTGELRAQAQGDTSVDIDAVVGSIRAENDEVASIIEVVDPGAVAAVLDQGQGRPRRLIPVAVR